MSVSLELIVLTIVMLLLIGACGYFWQTRTRYRDQLSQISTELAEVAANAS